jgi:hypothetical protein
MIKKKPTIVGSRYYYRPFNGVVEVVKLPDINGYFRCKCLSTGMYKFSEEDAKWAFKDWIELKNQDKPNET